MRYTTMRNARTDSAGACQALLKQRSRVGRDALRAVKHSEKQFIGTLAPALKLSKILTSISLQPSFCHLEQQIMF